MEGHRRRQGQAASLQKPGGIRKGNQLTARGDIPYEPVFTDEFEKELKWRKKRDRANYKRIMKKLSEILENPKIGKPLEYGLVGKRRVHIGHFVLSYRIDEGSHAVILDGFEHHDTAY